MAHFKEILIPVDFSDHSTAALESAIELARAFDSRLHLLHCYQIQPGGISPYGIAIPSSYSAEIRDAASQQLAAWQEERIPAGVSVDVSIVSEVPSEAIVGTANIGAKADGRTLAALRNNLFEARKCAAADKQDVCRVDLQKLLLRMLTATLRRYARNRAFHDF